MGKNCLASSPNTEIGYFFFFFYNILYEPHQFTLSAAGKTATTAKARKKPTHTKIHFRTQSAPQIDLRLFYKSSLLG